MTGMRARLLRRLRTNRKGNATMIVALGLPALIGAAGLGVDMAQLYAWKRELQHSVDQAAIAAAWELANDGDSTSYTQRANQEFNQNQVYSGAFDTTPVVELASFGSGSNNSVIVTSSVTKRLPFSSFLTNNTLTIAATAQASFSEGGSYRACLMALRRNQDLTFTVGGSAEVVASCGLGALSCEDDAIKINVKDDPGKKGVETDSIVACGTVDVPDYLQGKVTENATGVSNPFEDLPSPEPANSPTKSLNCPSGNRANNNTTIYPGTYSGMNMKCKITMVSGIYVIDGGVLDLTDQKTNVTGTKVMFVLKNGAQLKMGGQGNAGTLNLTPLEAADFVGTSNEAYKDLYGGMLIFEDTTDQTDPVTHTFRGNASISVRGTFYLPNGDLSINGNSNTTPLCFQLWAATLTITGNTSITTTCTNSQTNEAGSSAGGVRLVG